MADRPILFSGPMVRGILEDRKTVTRRVLTPRTSELGSGQWEWLDFDDVVRDGGVFAASGYLKVAASLAPEDSFMRETRHRLYPRIQPGDRLWVRETWAPEPCGCCWVYRATDPEARVDRWRPPIFMPRAACRLYLSVVDVRPERLHDIADDDIRAEGVVPQDGESLREAWVRLWDSINKGRGYGWRTDPWVWRVDFRRSR